MNEEPTTEPTTTEPTTTEEPTTEPATNEPTVVTGEVSVTDFDTLLESLRLLADDVTLSEQHTKAILELLTLQEQARQEEIANAEAEESNVSTEDVPNYQELTYQEIVTQTAILEEHTQHMQDSKTMLAEQSIMLTIAIVVVVGIKVFIDQITKW